MATIFARPYHFLDMDEDGDLYLIPSCYRAAWTQLRFDGLDDQLPYWLVKLDKPEKLQIFAFAINTENKEEV